MFRSVHISETSEKGRGSLYSVRIKSYHLHGEEPPLVELAFFQKSFRKSGVRGMVKEERRSRKMSQSQKDEWFMNVKDLIPRIRQIAFNCFL